MEVILLERVGRLGNMGEKVKVKDGYARNFLLPRSKAVRATKANLEQFEAQRAEREAKNAETRSKAQADAKKYDNLTLTLVRASSEDGKLYGSVSPRDVEAELAAKGHKVARTAIDLRTTIKNTGSYKVILQLHPEVEVPVTLNVVRNESDTVAEAPAEEEAAA